MEIKRTKQVDPRFRLTVDRLMRVHWRPGDVVEFTQDSGSPHLVRLKNLSLEERLTSG